MLEILTINIADQYFDEECINKDAEWNDNPKILDKLGYLEWYEEALGIDLRDLLTALYYGTYWSANREDVVKWRKENGWE